MKEEVRKMTEDRKCPYCGEVNRALHLDETDGRFICCKCEKVVDTKTQVRMTEPKLEKMPEKV